MVVNSSLQHCCSIQTCFMWVLSFCENCHSGAVRGCVSYCVERCPDREPGADIVPVLGVLRSVTSMPAFAFWTFVKLSSVLAVLESWIVCMFQ